MSGIKVSKDQRDCKASSYNDVTCGTIPSNTCNNPSQIRIESHLDTLATTGALDEGQLILWQHHEHYLINIKKPRASLNEQLLSYTGGRNTTNKRYVLRRNRAYSCQQVIWKRCNISIGQEPQTNACHSTCHSTCHFKGRRTRYL